MTSYRDAGVDQAGADALIPTFAKLAASTRRPEMMFGPGGFAGAIDIAAHAAAGRTLLVMSTDGVGTKVELLGRAGLYATAGIDAVAMNVDDVVCVGAEPLACVDYISIESLDSSVVTAIVEGVATGCKLAKCALVGGETSQHPGLLPVGGFDVVVTCIGLVDPAKMWGPDRVASGDYIVGLASSGPHSNGYSLIRKFDREVPFEMLAPTAIYAPAMLAAAQTVEIHAAAHVTGGGIVGNAERVLPAGFGATFNRHAWELPFWCEWILEQGMSMETLLQTFNGGLGMLMVSPDPEGLIQSLRSSGVTAYTVGQITDEEGIRI